MKILPLLSGLVIAAAFAGYVLVWNETRVQAGPPAAQAGFVPVNHQLPEFHLRDMYGRELSSADLLGKPAVIQIWASWCDICLHDVQNFVSLQRMFDGQAAFVSIRRGEVAGAMVSTDEPPAVEAAPESGVSFLYDAKDSVYAELDGFAMPEIILVGQNGAIQGRIRGPISKEELRRRIQQSFSL